MNCSCRADERTQVTADALMYIHDRLSVLAKGKRLMSTIPAGDDTASAADTFLALKSGINDRITLKLFCIALLKALI